MAEGERPEGPPQTPGTPGGDGASPPPLDESIRAIGEAGRASLGATVDAVRALRGLISADLALARSAAGRGLAWAGAAVVFGATGWLLATAAGVALMQRMGLTWLSALSIAALFNLVVTGLAAWGASHYFDYMGLHATRRQLSRLGLFDEHGHDVDDPDDGTTAATPSAPAGEPRA
ncbi:membrane protein [Pseudoxanthomonas suwonensis]|uniref:Membrane protein n=2 Tax=Pseudoxanthomonas suwonensis TaxID=314722 RepID=A0A0E3Z437_9GAMM|nr:phage holin family protein [Pseudoxanthomonas suwonensis]AKC87067.1 membrane protein [Pseudoxanthomonas suwonensis]